jgi:ketosteroid isomerase-like protein
MEFVDARLLLSTGSPPFDPSDLTGSDSSLGTKEHGMKRLLVVVALLVLAVPCLAFGQVPVQKAPPAKGQTAEQEVGALERAWLDAALKYDAAWYERHIADTMTNTDEEGVVTGKPAMLADVTSHATKYDTVTMDELKVQVYGDTAVATGIVVFKGTYKGKDLGGNSQFTDTWIKRAGQWQCVASHGTFITKK